VHTWIGERGEGNAADLETIDRIDDVLGVLRLARPEAAAQDPGLEGLLAERRSARAAKDFKASDAIRARLTALGYSVKDRPDGTVEVVRT